MNLGVHARTAVVTGSAAGTERFESPDEIGAVVAFVASDPARVINGAAVRADRGVVRSIF